MAKMITHKLHSLSLRRAQPPWLFSAISLFSTLADNGLRPLQSPFALFAASKLHLSSSDISRMFAKTPSLKTLQTLQNVERLLHILIQHGCTRQQIARIMVKHPLLLQMSAEKIVEPKIRLLKEYGIQGEILAKVLNRAPSVLGSSLERCLLPNIALLKNIFTPQDSLVTAISRTPFILQLNHESVLKPSLAFWEGWGLSGDELSKLLLANPLLLRVSSLSPAHLDLIRKIGIPPGNKMYNLILKHTAASRVETLEAKIQNLQRCGLSPEETLSVIRVQPSTFSYSEKTLGKRWTL